MTSPLELSVYEPDGSTLIATVPRRDMVQCSDEMNGVGAGRFRIHLDDPLLGTSPSLLDDLNIVKVGPSGASPVLAWQIEQTSLARIVDENQEEHRVATLAGRHVRAILERGVVLGAGEYRAYNFASPDLPGYPTGWDAPVGVLAADDTTARANNPVAFPDADAEWIWSTDPTATAPAERNWFRGEFTLASLTVVTIWAACDNSMSVHLNGIEIITSDATDLFAWRGFSTYRTTLPAGTYTVAAAVDNAAAAALNPGAFRCVVGTTDTAGGLDTVLLRTNETDWLVHPAADPPGWHFAQVLISALQESQAAGELPMEVTWDFDGDLDSAGMPWDDLRDVQVRVGEDLLTLSNRGAGTIYDIDMTPDLVLQAWKRKGSDLTATVELAEGVNVVEMTPTRRSAQIRNVIRFWHLGTWYEVEDSASVTAHGRRPIVLSFGDAGTIEEKTQLATEALVDLAYPQVTQPLAGSSLLGAQPFDDFTTGDTISAPGFLSGQADARVMTITLAEAENRIDWNIDLYPET